MNNFENSFKNSESNNTNSFSKSIKLFVKSHPKLYSISVFIITKFKQGFYIIRKQIYKIFDFKSDRKNLMINIGGGYFFRRHWYVLDYISNTYDRPKGLIDYNFDLTSDKPFPFENNSVGFFFTSHVLEHIPQEYCQHIFDEIYRCLKPGRAIRISTPDFDLAYETYGRGQLSSLVPEYKEPTEEQTFMHFFAGYLRDKVSPEDVKKNYSVMKKENFADYYTKQIPRKGLENFSNNHINWFNYEKIYKMLRKSGFTIIYRSTPQGSKFKEMKGSGRNTGFDSTYPEWSIFVEAIK